METVREEPSTSRTHVSTVGLKPWAKGHHYPLKPPKVFCRNRTCDSTLEPAPAKALLN